MRRWEHRTLVSLICLAVGCGLASQAEATIYTCRDSAGVIQFTNVPTASNCRVYKKKRSSVRSKVTSSKKRTNPNLYDSHIYSAGTRYKVDPHLIKAVIHVESDFDRYAVSKTGAQGLMQLMPGTARELRVSDPFNPQQNIHGGTRYLRKLFNMFGGDLTLTLAAYNAGPTVVKKVNRIPRIPETINYVKRVLHHYKKYRGGASQPARSNIKVGGLEIASTK